MSYNNKEYWNSLVGKEMSLKEVGWPQWTEAFNKARYQLAAEQTIATLQTIYTSAPLSILEIGCGTGFWTNILTTLYPNAIYLGIDISKSAINHLQEKYENNSNIQFTLADVGQENLILHFENYDLVICMEVLLHIINDHAWKNAMSNILNHTNKFAIISDPFIMYHGLQQSGSENNKLRKWTDYENEIKKNNASVISITPRTFLLDNNIDFKTKIGLKVWNLFFKLWNKLLQIKNEKLGNILGTIAYRFDKWHFKKTKYGNSCRQVLLKKN